MMEHKELSVGAVALAHQVAQVPVHLCNLCGATLSPTCFCALQMLSVSAAPTEQGDSDNTGTPPTQDCIVGTICPTTAGECKVSPFIKMEGGEMCPVLFDNDSLPIAIECQDKETVTVKVVHSFPVDSGLTYLALSFDDAKGNPNCLVEMLPDLGMTSKAVESMCDAVGFAQLEVVAAAPKFQGTTQDGARCLPNASSQCGSSLLSLIGHSVCP